MEEDGEDEAVAVSDFDDADNINTAGEGFGANVSATNVVVDHCVRSLLILDVVSTNGARGHGGIKKYRGRWREQLTFIKTPRQIRGKIRRSGIQKLRVPVFRLWMETPTSFS